MTNVILLTAFHCIKKQKKCITNKSDEKIDLDFAGLFYLFSFTVMHKKKVHPPSILCFHCRMVNFTLFADGLKYPSQNNNAGTIASLMFSWLMCFLSSGVLQNIKLAEVLLLQR